MSTRRLFALSAALLVALVIGSPVWATASRWSDPSRHKVGFVMANGVRLQYLDWGGTGPALIMIHGLSDNPHIFDDLAPAFTDHYHVIAYARRGHGRSQAAGPYDTATLTADLYALMHALGIVKANLVGWSMGGNEITALAAEHPEMVNRLVYFDSYDTADPDFAAAFKAIPPDLLETPPGAMASVNAFLSYEKAVNFASLNDISRVEAYLRDLVVVRPDGGLQFRMPDEVERSLLSSLWSNPRRDYRRVRSPVLAIYAESESDPHAIDLRQRDEALEWEHRYWAPFRAKSLEQMRQVLPGVRIISVPGSHMNFFLTSRRQVVAAMTDFLDTEAPR